MCVWCVHTFMYVCFSFCGSAPPPLQTIYGMASVRLIRHQSLLDSAARWPGEGISRTGESVRRLGLSPTESILTRLIIIANLLVAHSAESCKPVRDHLVGWLSRDATFFFILALCSFVCFFEMISNSKSAF